MKTLISLLAVLCLLCSFAAPSFADDYEVPVNVNIEAGTFKVSVPAGSIQINNSTNGKPQTYSICNTGDLPVKITKITVRPETDWENKTDYDFSGYKQFKIDIKGANEVIPVGSSKSYDYSVTVPAQVSSFKGKIATIVFTIALDDSTFAPILPKAVTPTLINIFNNDYYRIAEYNNCSLLLLKNPIFDGVSYQAPECALISDTSNDISFPGAGSSNCFELSKEEFTKYCSSETNYDDGSYCLRSAGYYINFNHIVEGSPSLIYHRYAIWVPNSSLPTS